MLLVAPHLDDASPDLGNSDDLGLGRWLALGSVSPSATQAVPEPGAIAMLAWGVVGLARLWRLRREA